MALLSGPTGPSSILGAGQTNVRRAINSRTNLDWRTKRGSVTSFETKYTIEQPYFGLVPDPKNALEEKYKKNIQQAEVVKGVFDAKPVDAPLVESRVCPYENSPDGNFILDTHPEADNCWFLGGGSGHGYKHGPALGEMAAGIVSGKRDLENLFRMR
jgi:hypothetical protein